MALIHYITYTEPDVKSGKDVRFFVREFDTARKIGRSLQFVEPVELIVPSFEMKKEEAPGRLEELARDFPGIEFERKNFFREKEVIWATIRNRKKPERTRLPRQFLDKKTSFSQQLRFYYPPFTLVPIRDGKLTRPSKFEKSAVSREIVLDDKKCSLDIETVDYNDPNEERISNVVIRFKDHGYIITTFVPPFKEFRRYRIISVRKSHDELIDLKRSTDAIKREVTGIIQSEDPLGIYGFNLPFDQEKLRKLGDEDYLPGVNMTGPVFKSVQGLKNMITKGRFSFDIYGYKFLYFNLYENNKLETHARREGIDFKKSLPYDILAYKTKKAEEGSLEDMIECLTYVAEDGDVMFQIGQNNEKKILSKALFVKREPSSICTSSGRSLMKEYWEKQYFLSRNTLRNRYEHGYRKRKEAKDNVEDQGEMLFKLAPDRKKAEYEEEFSVWKKKNELINPRRENGVFKDISIVYPLFLTKAFWPMIQGTTDNLALVGTPDEMLDANQTLDEYICHAVKDSEDYHEKAKREKTPSERDRRMGQFDYIMNREYNIWLSEARSNLEKTAGRMKELIGNSGQINYSNKFLFMRHPEQIVHEKLGFVYGRGNCLSCGRKVITRDGDSLIYQGFGISRGRRCIFDSRLLKGVLMRRLSRDDWSEEEIAQYMKEKMQEIESGEMKRGNLLFKDIGKRKFGGKSYGFSHGRELPIEDFIKAPSIDVRMYAQNFFDSYQDVLKVAFEDHLHRMYDALGFGGLDLKIPERTDEMEEALF